MAEFSPVQRLLADYRDKLPQHELEMIIEAAFGSRFPRTQRPGRFELKNLALQDSGLEWLSNAEHCFQRRLQEGVPVQHLTGEAHFYGRIFEAGPAALIPRPETEVLVATALAPLREQSGTLIGAEIGAGSGVISVTLLCELGERLNMVASEVDPGALALAGRNAKEAQVESRIEWVSVMDSEQVVGPLVGRGPFDFVISNPPYLSRSSLEVEAEVERFEPALALFAPSSDPLFYYREIKAGARTLLRPGGRVFLELAHERAGLTADLFRDRASGFTKVELVQDLSGRDRVLSAQWLG